MNILIVCSGNAPNFKFSMHQAFICDQVEAVKRAAPDIHFEIFFIQGKGAAGYLKSRRELLNKVKGSHFHCLHAHFSLSSMLANLQRNIPVITTFHGSDINVPRNRIISLGAELLSKRNIYVSAKLRDKAIYASKNKTAVIPCGVDFELFKPLPKSEARANMNLRPDKAYILFSSGFDNKVKNYPLARQALDMLNLPGVAILELKGYSRSETAMLFSAVDVALMTSFSEGSPQFIKEAMACNCPIVATDVGDIREVVGDTQGCYVTSFSPEDVARGIEKALSFGKRTTGREYIKHLDNKIIAGKIIQVYGDVLKKTGQTVR